MSNFKQVGSTSAVFAPEQLFEPASPDGQVSSQPTTRISVLIRRKSKGLAVRPVLDAFMLEKVA